MDKKFTYHILFAVLWLNVLISLYIFSNGFLIRRVSLNESNVHTNGNLKKFNKSILMFIDALRFDFIFGANSDIYGLATVESLIKNEPGKARLFRFIADPPTTTMQRIKALTTGSLPTFIDAGSNFDSYLIEDDNLIRQFSSNNRSVVVLGDDTWLSLFDASLIARHFTYPSFNIKDLDTNDENVNEMLSEILNGTMSGMDWNLIIAHYLGIDHCGHTYGPRSASMRRKLNDVDKSIRFVVDSMDEDTLLVIAGDHGMTETGDHGGDSYLELESALFFYSKKPIFKQQTNTDDMKYDPVSQINLTPTLALLLGVPIPFSNLGVAILDVFEGDLKLEAIQENLAQVKSFVKRYEQIDEILTRNEYDIIFENNMSNNNLTKRDLVQAVHNQLHSIQKIFRQKWSTFNDKYCLLGLLTLLLSIISITISMRVAFSYPNERPTLDAAIFAKNLTTNVAIFLFVNFLLCILLELNFISNLWIYLIIFNFHFMYKYFRLVNFLPVSHQTLADFKYVILAISYLIPFSNSYIVNENKSLRFLLITFVCVKIYEEASSLRVNLTRLFHLFAALFMIRISYIFYVCREEALLSCNQTIFSTQMEKLNNFGYFYYLMFIFINFLLVILIAHLVLNFSTCDNFNLFARKLDLFTLAHFIFLFVYYLVQLHAFYTDGTLSNSLKFANLYVARLVMLMGLFRIFKLWKSKENYDNLIVAFGIVLSLISGQALLSIWILIYVVFVVLGHYLTQQNIESNKLKKSNDWDLIILLYLIEHYFFYATGHETAFIHIKWESAFHGFYGDNNNRFVRIIMACLIISNTFSAILICSIFLTLLVCKSANRHQNVKLILKITFLNSIKLLISAVSVYLLRRHLMVWKIFAPRFVFDFIGIIVGFAVVYATFVSS